MNTIKRFIEPAKQAWGPLFRLSIFDMLVSAYWIFLIYGTQYIVKALENNNYDNFSHRILLLFIATIGVVLVKIFLSPYVMIVFRDLWDITDTICLPKVINGDNNKYEAIGTWRMIAIYGKGTMMRNNMLVNIFGEQTWSLLLFGAFLFTTYQTDINMFFGVLAMMVLVIIWFFIFGRSQYKRRKVSKERAVDIQRLQVKWFMSKYEIMQQDKVTQELAKRYELNNERYNAKRREKFHQSVAFDGSNFIVTTLFIFLLYYTGKQIFNGAMQYSDLIVIVGLWLAFIRDLDRIMRIVRTHIENRIDITKLRELIDELKVDYDLTSGNEFELNTGEIQFENLSYGYNTDSAVLNNLHLTIQWGKKTALVGISWSGKTTIAKLISWFLRPDSGSIIVDGQDLKEVSLKSYYKHIWYLTQDPSVFDGTVLDNLTYALKEEVSKEQIDKIIHLAKCEFIYSFPHGLETEIGERGVRLSWGQRQRLAIAKIFLKNPEIIILDEPTSALDSFSEEWITEAMHNLFKDRTVIIIAHRLQTVKEADDIIVLDGWEVIERGKHDELVQMWWAYAKMLELQSGF